MSLTDAKITFALTLALHDLGALTNVWLVMWIVGSLAIGLLVGSAAALGGDEEYARD